MQNFFDEAIQAAQRGEELSRQRDIQAYRTLFAKEHWNEAELGVVGEITQRAQTDAALWVAMEKIHTEFCEPLTPEDTAQTQKMIKRIIKQWEDHKS